MSVKRMIGLMALKDGFDVYSEISRSSLHQTAAFVIFLLYVYTFFYASSEPSRLVPGTQKQLEVHPIDEQERFYAAVVPVTPSVRRERDS